MQLAQLMLGDSTKPAAKTSENKRESEESQYEQNCWICPPAMLPWPTAPGSFLVSRLPARPGRSGRQAIFNSWIPWTPFAPARCGNAPQQRGRDASIFLDGDAVPGLGGLAPTGEILWMLLQLRSTSNPPRSFKSSQPSLALEQPSKSHTAWVSGQDKADAK